VLNYIDSEENAEYQRQRGYTEGISVRRPWRRRGVARALLTRSLKMFHDMGMHEAALGVDSQNLNGANLLYESVGFRLVQRFAIYRKPLSKPD
jgi:ribosomal protein S18 acetylase RimI-like enzyme